MAEKLLQINFKFNVTKDEYQAAANSLAAEFAKVDGLRWKVWILNEAENEAGGIYLFNDEASLDAYLNGPLAAQVKSHPAIEGMTAKPFDVMPEVTAITRGPI